MTSQSIRIDRVVFDPAVSRYNAELALCRAGATPKPLHVDIPGHRRWGYRRIAAALAEAATKTGGRHAGA